MQPHATQTWPRSRWRLRTAVSILALPLPAIAASQPVARNFTERASDGAFVRAVEDGPAGGGKAVVIMVSGTGLFDRDVKFGSSNTPRDLLFKDLSQRLVRLGLATVRYDRRGVVHNAKGPPTPDPAEAATLTVESQRDDLRALYDRMRSEGGSGARCIILFGHSEGVRHIAAIAESGAPAPLLTVGVGAPMRSPAQVMRWQMAERGVHALRLMDSDGNGEVSHAEIEANWSRTPASGLTALNPLHRPRKTLTDTDLGRMREWQLASYRRERANALALEDSAPFPNSKAPMGRASWWKSWFIDDRPIANRFAAWKSPIVLHYGAIDSQLLPDSEIAAARAALGDRLTVRVHPARGHALGENGLIGPMDEAIAEQIADEIAAAARGCPA